MEWQYRSRIRPHLPRRESTYNGVTVRADRLLDSYTPFNISHPEPEKYEDAIVSGLHSQVSTGDTVVIVGGGLGVSAVVAAQCTGSAGSVIVYEGSAEHVERVRETAKLNDVSERITVTHAVVGKAVQLRGEQGDAKVVAPCDLPECDLLELDCEGAELDILTDLESYPESVIVETHGFLGASTEEVQDVLEEKGYSILSESIADPAFESTCLSNDIRVLVGRDADTG